MSQQQFVTSVRVDTRGSHEWVTVWIEGRNVGTLTVGQGEGERLKRLLLAPDPAEEPWREEPTISEAPPDTLESVAAKAKAARQIFRQFVTGGETQPFALRMRELGATPLRSPWPDDARSPEEREARAQRLRRSGE